MIHGQNTSCWSLRRVCCKGPYLKVRSHSVECGSHRLPEFLLPYESNGWLPEHWAKSPAPRRKSPGSAGLRICFFLSQSRLALLVVAWAFTADPTSIEGRSGRARPGKGLGSIFSCLARLARLYEVGKPLPYPTSPTSRLTPAWARRRDVQDGTVLGLYRKHYWPARNVHTVLFDVYKCPCVFRLRLQLRLLQVPWLSTRINIGRRQSEGAWQMSTMVRRMSALLNCALVGSALDVDYSVPQSSVGTPRFGAGRCAYVL